MSGPRFSLSRPNLRGRADNQVTEAIDRLYDGVAGLHDRLGQLEVSPPPRSIRIIRNELQVGGSAPLNLTQLPGSIDLDDEAEAGEGLLLRTDGSDSLTGARTVAASWTFTASRFLQGQLNYHEFAADVPVEVFRRASGSLSSPTDVSATDQLGGLRFDGYRNGDWRTAAQIVAVADALGVSSVDGRLEFGIAQGGTVNNELIIFPNEFRVLTNFASFPDGTESAPGVTFSLDTNTGLYRVGANQLGVVTQGIDRIRVSNSHTIVTNQLFVNLDDGVSGTARALPIDVNVPTGWVNDFVQCTVNGVASGQAEFAVTVDGEVLAGQSSNGHAFILDLDTGMYRAAANHGVLQAGGVDCLEFGVSTGVPGGNPQLGFFGTAPQSQDTGWTTFTNLAADKTCDADATTVEELADILGTLIEQLKSYGLLSS